MNIVRPLGTSMLYWLLAIVAIVTFQHSTALAQGSLTPPGPPAPTMKSLDQIEARTPISSAPFTITNSGSYYLTTNLAASGANGITINASQVTLDLNGFSVLGTSSATNGIYVSSPSFTNITVRNGIITGWTQPGVGGIVCFGHNAIFEHLTISANSEGLFCDGGTIVRDCVVSGNLRTGIDVSGSGSLIVDNVCAGNNAAGLAGNAGIFVEGSNNRIERNHVTASSSAGFGISIFGVSSDTNNIVIQNSVEGNVASNYSFNASQVVGPIITNTAAGIITNSNPWANFSF